MFIRRDLALGTLRAHCTPAGTGDHAGINTTKDQPMAQATIKNQLKIMANQRNIVANQNKILRNQDLLSTIVANQVKIIRNQQAIVKNQKKILAARGSRAK
jgi:hypothetical protein